MSLSRLSDVPVSRHARRLSLLLALVVGGPAAVPGADLPEMNSEMAGHVHVVRYRIVQGSIEGFAPQGDRNVTLTASRNARQERLAMVLVEGTPTFEYSLDDPDLKMRIEMREGHTVHIEMTPADATQTGLTFDQDADRQHTLTLTKDGTASRFRAPTLWHLWLAHPHECATLLVPILGMLRPDWDSLPQMVERTEVALLRSAGLRRGHDWNRWAQAVADLAQPDFAVREAADRELRQAGQAVLPYLKGLKRDRLDAEQRFRIRLILESLSGNYEDDTPGNVAAWLIADPVAWLALLDRPQLDVRQSALEQLSRLLPDETIDFDPAADEPTRQRQLDALRSRLQPAAP